MNSRVMILLAVLLVLGAAIAGYLGYQATSEATAAADAARRHAAELLGGRSDRRR